MQHLESVETKILHSSRVIMIPSQDSDQIKKTVAFNKVEIKEN
jgi:hypothetical protein